MLVGKYFGVNILLDNPGTLKANITTDLLHAHVQA